MFYTVLFVLLSASSLLQDGDPPICQNQCIAYFSESTETPGLVGDLVLFDPETKQEMVVPDTVNEPTSLAWSPDGQRLVFGWDASALDLASMEVETFAPIPMFERFPEHGTYTWLPDGEKIVFFQGIRDANTGEYQPTLFLMNPDGTKWQQLTPDIMNGIDPDVSPDGTVLTFTGRMRSDDEEYANPDIYVFSLTTGEIRRLTDNQSRNVMPNWSSDGEHIAYISDFQLFVMNADGSEQTQLTEEGAAFARWALEDTHLVFTVRDEAHSYLNLIDLETGTITTLRSHRFITTFVLSPDRTQIVYGSSDSSNSNKVCSFSLIDASVEWCTETQPHQATGLAWGG